MSTRTEVLDRHSPMLESITPLAAAQLAQYVLRNALLELEVRLSGQLETDLIIEDLYRPLPVIESHENGYVTNMPNEKAVRLGLLPATEPGQAASVEVVSDPGNAPKPQALIDWSAPDRLSRLPDELRVTVDVLAKQEATWRQVSKPQRLAILQWAVQTINPVHPPTMDEFNSLRPSWMPTASSMTMTVLEGGWKELEHLWAAAAV